MILRNLDALLGRSLRHSRRTTIEAHDGIITYAGKDDGRGGTDAGGLIAVPGLVNMHTHVGDSIAKDAASGDTDYTVHPISGLKPRVLSRTRPGHLEAFVGTACRSMLSRGITTFVDFREGGMEGIRMLRRATSGIPIRPVILGRAEGYHNAGDIRRNALPDDAVLREARSVSRAGDGMGISGANENSDAALRSYSAIPGIRAIHAAETRESVSRSRRITARSEVRRALLMRPHLLVHMTHATVSEMRLASRCTRGIIVCPRANASLAGGIPDIRAMLRAGCTVGLGTDNVMINQPDMFREMDYLWKVSQAVSQKRVAPAEILKMATVNASRLLGRKIGVIAAGFAADILLVEKHSADLEPMHDIHASLVHRVSHSDIRAVISGGEVVHGDI